MKSVLVIGASGLVGYHLVNLYQQRGYQVTGTAFSQKNPSLEPLDMADASAVARLLERVRPSHVVVPAAFTNVDVCESDPNVGSRVNVTGVRIVAETASEVGAHMTYFSTDYVFDGESGPYNEAATPKPVNNYGRQKELGEQILAEVLPERHLIVRTTWVFGWEPRPRNFIARLVAANRSGEIVRIPVDQFGSPTYAPNLAGAVVDLQEQGCTGIYHVAGTDVMDRYQFALLAADVLGLNPALIQGVETSQLGQVAQRPMKGGLVVDKALALVTGLVSARQGLVNLQEAGAPA